MRWIVVLALLAGCDKKKNESTEAPAPVAAETKPPETKPAETPVARVPGHAEAVPVGNRFELKVRELGASDPATLDQAKERLKYSIKDVIHEENTADGYILTFSMSKAEMKEDADGRVHRDESGVEYAVQVRLAIDGKPTKCSAIVEKREDVQAAVDACKARATQN